MTSPKPKHREKRNYRLEQTPQTTELETPEGPISVTTHDVQSVVEQYCAHCEQWITVEGVTGSLRFMAHHNSEDCSKGAPKAKSAEGAPRAES